MFGKTKASEQLGSLRMSLIIFETLMHKCEIMTQITCFIQLFQICTDRIYTTSTHKYTSLAICSQTAGGKVNLLSSKLRIATCAHQILVDYTFHHLLPLAIVAGDSTSCSHFPHSTAINGPRLHYFNKDVRLQTYNPFPGTKAHWTQQELLLSRHV